MLFVGIGLAICLTGITPSSAQKNPEPYDSSKPKKSESKSDSTSTKEAKADSVSTKESKTDSASTKEEKLEGEKPKEKNAETKKPASGAVTDSTHIKRATFTDAIVDREPGLIIDQLTTDVERVYFFTEVVDMAGAQIKHQWIYKDEVVVEVPIQIGGPRWRCYSSKKLLPSWVGEWKVAVVDETGKKLYEDKFAYVAPTE